MLVFQRDRATERSDFRFRDLVTPREGVINRTEVLHLFMTQHGVASVEQLRALPVSLDAIQRARRQGTVVNVLPGIVRLAGTDESFVSRATTLLLHVGDGSFISGVSAGVLHLSLIHISEPTRPY